MPTPPLDRLLSAGAPYSETFSYDLLGNLAERGVAGSPVTYTYGLSTTVLPPVLPPPGSYRAYLPLALHGYAEGMRYPQISVHATSGQPFAVQALSDGRQFGYDANGNMITRTTYTQAFDAENRLCVITDTLGGAVTHITYDGDGVRLVQSNGTTTTLYLNDLVEITIGPTERYTRTFLYAGGQRIAMRLDREGTWSALTYLHADHLGAPPWPRGARTPSHAAYTSLWCCGREGKPEQRGPDWAS